MSGGFFRGTSADQDTRFSNKQAKLLKSQKFAPELDHAVDMNKVNLDVMKPWIATRVTELLGFEDEVLINFIYELLEKKVVDGKKVQIQLTGFMEKNTGKFMKELWSLLLTAQNNVSGVPQQFLDAKEEETRKKKAETDRITEEIQKMREREEREFDREKQNKMGADVDNSRNSNPVHDSVSEYSLPKTAEDKKDRERRHSPRTKSRRSKSPHSNERTPVSRRSTSSSDRSSGKPFSNSRGYSQEGLRARSSSVSSGSRKLSASPVGRRRSDSPRRKKMSVSRRSISPRYRRSSPKLRSPLRRSPQKRRSSTSRSRQRHSPIRRRSPRARYRSPSLPQRRSPSPPRRKSPTSSHHRSPSPSRRRSPSPPRRRSPSPPRRRSPSPPRRRSPSPLRRRSPSPLRRRSPSPPRRRSPSPPRRRYPSPPWRRSPSPLRQRSPSPMRRRSPVRRKSPSHLRHRSPIRRRSLSPAKRRSPTPLKGRSPPKYQRSSPLLSPRSRAADSRMSLRQRNRSRSPDRSWMPSYRSRRSSSRDGDEHVNGIHSSRYRDEDVSERAQRKKSPDHHSMGRNTAEHSDLKRKVPDTVSRQRDLRVKSDTVSLDHSDFQEDMNRMKSRSSSLSASPVKQSKKRLPRHDSPETNEGKTTRAREDVRHRTDYLYKRSKHSPVDVTKKSISDGKGLEIHSPDRSAVSFSPIGRDYPINLESRKEDRQLRSEIDAPEKNDRVFPSLEGKEYGPGRGNEEHRSVGDAYEEHQIKKQSSRDGAYFKNSTRDDHSRSKDEDYKESLVEDYAKKSKHKVHKSDKLNYIDTDSEEGDTYRYHSKEKRKNKKSDNHKRDLVGVAEYGTQVDDKKEAKRRRKDEKRQHKEERRRRREERHRRRLERRAGKLELKSVDTVTPPSDLEKNLDDAHRTDDEIAMQGVSHLSDTEETESEQKKLEIDLRKKALESLRAKKAINP